MKQKIRNILLIIMLCVCIESVYSEQFKLPDAAEDAGYLISYRQFRINLPTYYYNDSLYIPLTQTLGFLKIYTSAQNSMNEISGYIAKRDSSFEININQRTAALSNRTIEFSDSDFIRDEFEIYFVPSFFEKVFGLKCQVYPSDLSIRMESKVDLPIILEVNRKKTYTYLNAKDNMKEKDYPLLYGRSFNVIDGGILNYTLSGNQSSRSNSYAYGAGLGLQVLGGDMLFNSYGFFDNTSNKFENTNNWRWRYDLDNNWVSNITIGQIYPTNYRTSTFNSVVMRSEQYQGIQISNEKIQHNYFFSNILIEDKLEANWQVELYVNGQLYSHQTTDALGYYRFELPINYGNNNVTLKIYGPNGECIDKAKVITVPNDFLRPGTVKYSLGGGIAELSDNYQVTGMIAVGISDWLTNSINAQKNEFKDEISLLNHTAIRVGDNLSLGADYSPENLYSGSLNLWSDSWGTYSVAYTKYLGYSDFNNRGAENSLDFNASLPRIEGLPINIMVRGSRIEAERSTNYSLSSDLRMYLRYFDVGVRYSANLYEYAGQSNNLRQEISPTLNISWYDKPNFLSFLNSSRLSIGTNYSTQIRKLTYATVAIDQAFLKDFSLRLNYRYDLIYKLSTMSLSLQMNLPAFRTNTSSNYAENSSPYYSQTISGMLGYNSAINTFNFNNSQSFGSVGTGAASFRFYLDENDNNIFDKGEYEITDVKVGVSVGSVRTNPGGATVVYSIPSGERINVSVNLESIKNPLWMPKTNEFSLIAEPNSFKAIDVPCFASGMVEGRVIKNDVAMSGQAGVRIHLRDRYSDERISINVFSDGSFYHYGIPPKEYEVSVDSSQLAILKVRSEPAVKYIKINSKMEGDYVGDLNFKLIPIVDNNIKINIPEPELLAADFDYKSIDSVVSLKNVLDTADIKINKKQTFLYPESKVVALNSDMKLNLEKIRLYLVAHPKAKLYVEGHTDVFGTLDEHRKVSVKRADAVKQYLTGKGIQRNRILTNGKGSLYPVAENFTEQGRRKNRRVELNITE